MADKVFIADKTTLDLVKVDTGKLVEAKSPVLRDFKSTRLMQINRGLTLGSPGTSRLVDVTGSGHLYYVLAQLVTSQCQLKITIDGIVVFHRSLGTSTSGTYGGLVHYPSLIPVNFETSTYKVPGVDNTTVNLTTLSQPPSSLHRTGSCDTCYIPVPFRFEKSLRIELIDNSTTQSSINVYYMYISD